MKQLIISTASKLIPKDGKLREIAINAYGRLFPQKPEKDIIHRVLSDDERIKLNESVRIGFVGDLILLRDMVEAAKEGTGYNYQPMFDRMKGYFSECDLMTGVLEGPLPGEEIGYTTANYEDGRPLKCGYPDSFLEAIEEAGINFVTIANNHLYDMGHKGMERTIGILERKAMPYVGYGTNARRLVEVNGLRIAILAYTYGFNGRKESFFFQAGNENLPHLIRPKGSKVYKECLSQVKEDFKWAKDQNPDTIIVYPHIGDQFRHSPDKNQLHWFEVFKSLGADVILGCHSHATQPLRFEEDTLCLYCPGNFVNNYFPHDGDASAMVEVYLNKKTGKPFAASVIPIWAYGKRHNLLQAVPMSEISGNNEMSWHEWFRLQDAHNTVTGSMLGLRIPIEQAQKKYIIWSDNQYRRNSYEPQKAVSLKPGTEAAKIFEEASTIVFIGDSITEGTKNGGYGWFEPLMATMPDKKVIRYAKGGATSRTLLEDLGDMIKNTEAEVFCIAIGCNDIRYRNSEKCAMSADEFRNNISKLVSIIKDRNPEASVVLVAPWHSDDGYDKFCRVETKEKNNLYLSYTQSLMKIGGYFVCRSQSCYMEYDSFRYSA